MIATGIPWGETIGQAMPAGVPGAIATMATITRAIVISTMATMITMTRAISSMATITRAIVIATMATMITITRAITTWIPGTRMLAPVRGTMDIPGATPNAITMGVGTALITTGGNNRIAGAIQAATPGGKQVMAGMIGVTMPITRAGGEALCIIALVG